MPLQIVETEKYPTSQNMKTGQTVQSLDAGGMKKQEL